MADYKLPVITGTALTTGDVLRWNGSAWVNYADSNFGGGGGTKIFAYMGSTQSISRLTWTKLELDTEEFDTLGEYDKDTNYRFTVTAAGYYLIQASCYISLEQADVQYLFRIYKNGDTNIMYYTQHTANTQAHSSGGGRIAYLDVDDYLELWVYHKHPSLSKLVYGGSADFTSLSITRIF